MEKGKPKSVVSFFYRLVFVPSRLVTSLSNGTSSSGVRRADEVRGNSRQGLPEEMLRRHKQTKKVKQIEKSV